MTLPDDTTGAAMTADHREVRTVLRNIYACFFLSGALGLVYQILWLRKLLLVFGSTVHAVSTVLTVFFGGLALGSWLLGRLIDRHAVAGLRWYAALEAGVGLYAFITLPLFAVIQQVYLPIYRASGFSPVVLVAASFVCSAAILLLPTTLLGGTFPVLSRFLIRTSGERGVKIAGLYGINTAGAVVGTIFVYYVGLPMLGLFRTLLCAGVLNIGIGALCLTFDRHLEQLGFRAGPATALGGASAAVERTEDTRLIRWLLIAFGCSGFSAMLYEVAWTRALSLVLGSSIYAFCIMLATFLGGMALGSLRARRYLAVRPASLQQFIVNELLLGAYGLISIPFFSQLPDWFVALWPLTGGSFTALGGVQFALCALVMMIPTFLMGYLFPLVSDLVTRRFGQLGQRLGGAYAINTLGGIAGSFLSGFILIPLWGLPSAIVVAALVNFAAGLMVYVCRASRGVIPRAAFAVALLGGVVVLSRTAVLPAWQRHVLAAGVFIGPESYRHRSVAKTIGGTELLYYRDGLNATVSVHRMGESLFLKVGGKTDASNGVDMGTQVLSAHIPMLLHPDPQRVLVVGLGSGVTLGHAGRYPVSLLHCAEIEDAVVEGARFFKEYNYGIHDDPRVKFFTADGRNLLLANPQQYDVIISEPSNPWMAGIAYLFTREFYQLAKRRLAPGGIMCQWLQLYSLFPGDVKIMLRTFHEEFPHMSVWSSIYGDVLLVGSMEPHTVEFSRLAERMAVPAIRDSLQVVRIDRPEVLLQLFWFGNEEVERLTADTPWIHGDDQPWLEFSAPKALYARQMLVANAGGLEQFKREPQAIANGYDPARETAEFHRAMGLLWIARGQYDKAKAAFEQAIRLDPSSADAWVELGKLYLQDGEHLKAQGALTKAVELAPGSAEAFRMLGRLYRQQHQLEEARRAYERAASLEATDGLVAEETGDLMREVHELPMAAEYYRSALSQGGGSRIHLVVAYGEVLKDLKSWEMAEQLLRFGIASFRNEGALPLLLGETLLEQQRGSEAEPWFRRALAVAPQSARAYDGLGRIALGDGRVAEAVRYLKRALQYAPYDRKAAELLGDINRAKGT